MCGFDRCLALFLSGAVLSLALCLRGLYRCLCLDDPGLQRDRMQFPDPLEVRVIFRKNDAGYIELRDRKTIFLETGLDLLLKVIGDQAEVLVDLQDIDRLGLNDCRKICLDVNYILFL